MAIKHEWGGADSIEWGGTPTPPEINPWGSSPAFVASVTMEGGIPFTADCWNVPFEANVTFTASRNDNVYVVDSGNHRVQAFSPTGVYRFEFGSYGTGDGEFNTPYGIADDGDYLWVTDTGNNRVQKFTYEGVFIEAFGTGGTGDGQFDSPYGIAVNDKFIFVIDHDNNRFQIFNKDGSFNFELGEYGTGPDQFDGPTDCWVDDVYLYIDDTGNGRTVMYVLTGLGWDGYADLELPVLELACEMVQNHNYLDADLPVLELDATISVGAVVTADLELPMLELSCYAGGHADLELPMLEIEASVEVGLVISADLELPVLEADSSGSVSKFITADLELPMLEATVNVIVGHLITADIELPMLEISTRGVMGNTIEADLDLPVLEIEASGYSSASITVDLELPMLILDSHGFVEPAGATYAAVVVNTETGAISEYPEYPFDSMTYFNDLYIGANENGIYSLTGDDDAGTDIDANLKTHSRDYHEGSINRLYEARIICRTTGVLKVSVEGDENAAREYYVQGDRDGKIQEKRVKMAKGMKDRHNSLTISNMDGADFELIGLRTFVNSLNRIR